MNKPLIIAAATAALLPFCTAAQADAHSSSAANADMYVGASVGKGKHNIKFDEPASTKPYHDPDVTTMSLYLGKDLSEVFAIEGFYTNLGESKIYFDAANNTNVKITTMGIAVKAGTNFSDDIRGFVKVGYHSWKSDVDDLTSGVAAKEKNDDTDPLYGIGVEYKLSESTAIVAAYDRYTVDKSNFTDMSIGIKYRF